jgi:hypothetical protein
MADEFVEPKAEESTVVPLKSECEVDSSPTVEPFNSQVNLVVKSEGTEEVDSVTDMKSVFVSEVVMESKGEASLGQICNVCLAITLDLDNHSR